MLKLVVYNVFLLCVISVVVVDSLQKSSRLGCFNVW